MARDLPRVAHVREVIGDDAELFVDANGGYSRKQAVRVGLCFASEFGVSWFDKPVSSDDLGGLREVRGHAPCDIAAGEYGYDEPYFAKIVRADSVDCLQIDVIRCGGYTSWLRAAAIAAANGLEVLGHCAPSLHAPVAAAVPNLRHVEYFHDHERVDALLFEGCLVSIGGDLRFAPGATGHGVGLREADDLVWDKARRGVHERKKPWTGKRRLTDEVWLFLRPSNMFLLRFATTWAVPGKYSVRAKMAFKQLVAGSIPAEATSCINV